MLLAGLGEPFSPAAVRRAAELVDQAKRPAAIQVAVFTIAKGGLMFSASVAGQKFSFSPHGSK